MKCKRQKGSVERKGRETHSYFLDATRSPLHATHQGFTLIELMVSVSLFIVVMMVSVGALLSLVTANRKARALESVVNNLNVSLDGMVRAIRMGSQYACGDPDTLPNPSVGQDCANGGAKISFAPFGFPDDDNKRIVYRFSDTDNKIYRSLNGGASELAITAPEVQIDSLKFHVVGTKVTGNFTQPKVVIVVKGTAGEASNKSKTGFMIQATAVQRVLDI